MFTIRYSQGKATALVVDIGHKNTSVTALYDGMVLRKGNWFDTFAHIRQPTDLNQHQVTHLWPASG
jgi:hypothetical protein